jgi:hypothetical protein
VFGLAYVVMAGYLTYRAFHDGSVAIDGLVMGYAVAVVVGLVVLNRRLRAGRTERIT